MKRMALVIALFLVGCGSSKSDPKEPIEPKEPVASEGGGMDLLTVCVKTFERQYECTDDFIPALVDIRIKHGLLPATVANLPKQEGGREKLIEMALEEWKTDGTEPKLTESCQTMIQVVSAEESEEESEELRAAGEKCLATADCRSFVDCMMPVVEKQMLKPPRKVPPQDAPADEPAAEPAAVDTPTDA